MNHDEFDRYIQQDAVLDLLIFSEVMDDVLLALEEGRLHPRMVTAEDGTAARLADIANHGRRLIAALDHLLEV